MFEDVEATKAQEMVEGVLMEAQGVEPENPRIVALEMAMSLICNRSDGTDGVDAVEVTRTADVLLDWLIRK